MTLTKSNQGFHDRVKRATSWIARAKACAALDWEDDHGQFVFYWIALSPDLPLDHATARQRRRVAPHFVSPAGLSAEP